MNRVRLLTPVLFNIQLILIAISLFSLGRFRTQWQYAQDWIVANQLELLAQLTPDFVEKTVPELRKQALTKQLRHSFMPMLEAVTGRRVDVSRAEFDLDEIDSLLTVHFFDNRVQDRQHLLAHLCGTGRLLFQRIEVPDAQEHRLRLECRWWNGSWWSTTQCWGRAPEEEFQVAEPPDPRTTPVAPVNLWESPYQFKGLTAKDLWLYGNFHELRERLIAAGLIGRGDRDGAPIEIRSVRLRNDFFARDTANDYAWEIELARSGSGAPSVALIFDAIKPDDLDETGLEGTFIAFTNMLRNRTAVDVSYQDIFHGRHINDLDLALTDAERRSDIDQILEEYRQRLMTATGPQELFGLLIDPPSMTIFVQCLFLLCHVYILSQVHYAQRFSPLKEHVQLLVRWPGFQDDWLSTALHALSFHVAPFLLVALYSTSQEALRANLFGTLAPLNVPVDPYRIESIVGYFLLSLTWVIAAMNESAIIAACRRRTQGKIMVMTALGFCGFVIMLPIQFLPDRLVPVLSYDADVTLRLFLWLLHMAIVFAFFLVYDYTPEDRVREQARWPKLAALRRSVHQRLFGELPQ